tara:strand:+ start:143 stop:769 length:627 start_codon:yes stop_codon:yes gene_type:complete
MKFFKKVCGITSLDDLEVILNEDINAIGFITDKTSPRYVDLSFLKEASKLFNREIFAVPVFVNESKKTIEKISDLFEKPILQFHGDEKEDFCNSFKRPYLKALSAKDSNSLKRIDNYKSAEAILLDSGSSLIRGGTGKTFNWKLIPKNVNNKIIIAGGLNSNNITVLLDEYCPDGIDVSSGIESKPGKKDIAKLREFLNKIEAYEKRT